MSGRSTRPRAASQADLAKREQTSLAGLALVAAATVAIGVWHAATGRELGTATPPFVAGWLPQLAPAAVVALGLVPVVAWSAPGLRDRRLRPAAVALALLGLALAAGLAVGAMRLGPAGWSHVFDLGPGGSFEAANEYLPGLPTLQWGVGPYLDRFAETVPSQPVNVAGHPPGPLLLMRALGIDGPGGLAALCIGAAAACAPLTYLLARAARGPAADRERTARTAGLLAALTPIVLLDGVTSFDAVYAAFGAAAAIPLLSRRRAVAAVGALLLALATLFSWALLGIGAAVAVLRWRRDGWRVAAAVAALCAIAWLAVNGLLALAWGYDPIGTLRATEGVYRNSLARIRPYWFWLFGSPVAWALMLGPAVAAALVRSALRGSAAGRAIVAVVAFAAIAGFTKAETERIWLIFVPLACVAAAEAIPDRRLRPVLLLLAAQALAIQALANTVW
ncbi:hypothetical protein [Patulibacter defluvii]|uniref:hypothetical protein n=1 Tax=Patulibacter defluvii TaxID=3095358 RepID=UPI002A74AB90|nr:hypothetical protein [Patulibacter sp. DM4]